MIRKPKLKWERSPVGAGLYQWRTEAGKLFTLYVDEPEPEREAADDACDVEAAKLAAEDYVLAELTKGAAAFGKVLVDTEAAK